MAHWCRTRLASASLAPNTIRTVTEPRRTYRKSGSIRNRLCKALSFSRITATPRVSATSGFVHSIRKRSSTPRKRIQGRVVDWHPRSTPAYSESSNYSSISNRCRFWRATSDCASLSPITFSFLGSQRIFRPKRAAIPARWQVVNAR